MKEYYIWHAKGRPIYFVEFYETLPQRAMESVINIVMLSNVGKIHGTAVDVEIGQNSPTIKVRKVESFFNHQAISRLYRLLNRAIGRGQHRHLKEYHPFIAKMINSSYQNFLTGTQDEFTSNQYWSLANRFLESFGYSPI